MVNRPSSYSPLGSGHRSSAGGRRRFFGLSETAEAEAEAAALLAKRSEAAGGKGAAAARGEGTPTMVGKSDSGAQKHCIEAHRFLLSLRSDPMRAMLRSGKCDLSSLFRDLVLVVVQHTPGKWPPPGAVRKLALRC